MENKNISSNAPQIQRKKHMGAKAKTTITNTIIYIILITMCILWVVPFFMIIFQSFRVETTQPVGYIFPKQWGFDNYVKLFTETKFLKWYGNTLVVALFSCVLQTLIQLSVSYALSRFRFKGRKLIMNFMLVLGMFPGFLTMLILYFVLKKIGFTQEHAVYGLILVYVASSGMGYYVSKGFFDTIPKSLDEAARVDGATRFQVFYKIMLPMSKPIVIYTLLTAFMAPWADFIFAKFIAFNNTEGYNVAVGLWSWLDKDMIAQKYTLFCAGGVVVAIPVAILFLCLQKYYVEGVTGGAVKG